MPFKDPKTITGPDFGSIWIEGEPNSGKTYSIRTFKKPVAVISFPGEKGHASVPFEEGVIPFIWEDDGTPMKDRDTLYYMKIWREVTQTTTDITTGKYGPVETIFGDGVHKFYRIGLAIATDGESERLQSAFIRNDKGLMVGEFDPRCYGKATSLIFQYAQLVFASKVPTRVLTSWVRDRKDDPKDMSKNAPSHLKPALPGQAADLVLGECSVVLHACIDPTGNYKWVTKATTKVAGANMKGPREVIEKVPAMIPQDFAVLEKYLNVSKEEVAA